MPFWRLLNIRSYIDLGAYLDHGRLNLTVWAPLHNKVSFHPLNGEEIDLIRNGEYFSVEIEGSYDHSLYFLKVDGKLLADPLSRFQPEGVNGPSMIVDHGKYAWSNDHWKSPNVGDLLLYEMHVGTFTGEGTYRSAEDKLGYLKDLGVNAIEIMPLSQAYGSRNWGYDGAFPFAPPYSYGTPEELMHFVDRSHSLGMSCILDIVCNHFGPVGNVFLSYAPYTTKKYKTPWGDAINFDGSFSPGVREMLLANASYWVRAFRFDGFRMDSTQNIYDSSPKHFLVEMTDHVRSLSSDLGRKVVMIAESDKNDVAVIKPQEKCGLGFDMVWADDLHHSFHSYMTGERSGYYSDYGNFSDIADNIRQGFLFNGKFSNYLKYRRGTDFSGQDPASLIVALQNHDQIGNRALGERISSLVSFEDLKLGASLFILSPFTPMIFMGEEYGETSPFWFFIQSDDKKFSDLVNAGRRSEFKEFDWPDRIRDPGTEDAFNESKLKWPGEDRNRAILCLYRDLISLRKQHLRHQVRRKYNVILKDDLISIEYPAAGAFIIHNFGNKAVNVTENVVLNTSSPRYGGTNNDRNKLSEHGSIFCISE